MSRLYIFTGHFGSGKTEVAINFALNLKQRDPSRPVALIDLDIINPFFRSADAKDLLEKSGVQVELPIFANTNIDIPALTGNMGSIIENKDYDVILDIGGDDLGAHAVGRYCEEIAGRDYILYFVTNVKRPFTSTVPLACKIFDEVQDAARLKISGLVNNSNMLEQTTVETVLEALPLLKEVSAQKNVPILFHSAFKPVAEELMKILDNETVLPMQEYVKLLWKRGN